jgi:serine protease
MVRNPMPSYTRAIAISTAIAILMALTGCTRSRQPHRAPPPLAFVVDEKVRPPAVEVTDRHGRRPVAAVRDSLGNDTFFMANELVVRVSAGADEKQIVAGLAGTVLERQSVPSKLGDGVLLLIRVDTRTADVSHLATDAKQLTPSAFGAHAVSSKQALELLAIAFQARAHGGPQANLNVVGGTAGLIDRLVTRSTPEDGSGTAPLNSFTWTYMRDGGTQDIGVGDAWRQLALAGKLPEQGGQRIKVGIMDAGFIESQDLPRPALINGEFRIRGFDGPPRTLPNTWGCSTGPGCRWHGSDVAHTLAALPGNNLGVAGPAGPVADLVLLQSPTEIVSSFGYLIGLIRILAGGPRIINISVDFELGAALFPLADIASTVTGLVRAAGTLIFAAAGNKNTDIDAYSCWLVCWENIIHFPCELVGVTCVGGLGNDSANRDPQSNFGAPDGGIDHRGVQIFGPYNVFVPTTPGLTGVQMQSGTSVASPFVAGVAALIWAADPSRGAADVEHILFSTAHVGGRGSGVNRWVDASAGVHAALGQVCEPPTVAIVAPEPNAVVSTGEPVTLRARGSDGGRPLPDSGFTWSANGAAIGSGSTVQHTFTAAGIYQVRVTARGCSAVPTTRTRQVTARTVVTSAGQVNIRYPADGAVLYATDWEPGPADRRSYIDVRLSGFARNSDGTEVPDGDRLRWRSSSEGDIGTGRTPQVRLHAGQCTSVRHTLTLEAFAPDGTLIGSATVRVTIIPPPC